MAEPSPRIRRLEWGDIDTEAGTFRDAKLWPGGGRGWDWRETGTEHVPGVQPADVAEVLEHAPDIVVVGRGQQGRLQVQRETLEAVRRHGATPEVLGTVEAVERYNALAAAGARVGALIHTTC